MASTRFTIVIPTRNRPETLRHALATVVDQRFASLEILVSDNGSGRATEELVRSVADTRVRYLRPPRELAMADHWEFALRAASGEFVGILGDDDALLPGAIEAAEHILSSTRARALRWDGVQYVWPSVPVPEVAGRIIVPLDPVLRRFWYRDVISQVANFQAGFCLLPGPYTGVVHRDVLTAVQAHTGRVFAGSSPDIYSGFACAYVLREYLSLGRPLSIWGASQGSNGVSAFLARGAAAARVDFESLNSAAGLAADPRAPALPVLPACIADMFWQAKTRLFPSDGLLSVDRRRLCRNVVAVAVADGRVAPEGILAAVRASVADDDSLDHWLSETYPKGAFAGFGQGLPQPPWGLGSRQLVLDSRDFGVNDIQEAARFVSKLLGPHSWTTAPTSQGTTLLKGLRRAADSLLRAALGRIGHNVRPLSGTSESEHVTGQ